MRVSINKLTGKMIESQSGGETHPDPKIDDKEYAAMNLKTLKQNAINQGHLEKDIEVKFATQEEYETLLEASISEPTEAELYEIAIKAKEAEILRGMAIAELEAEKIVSERPAS